MDNGQQPQTNRTFVYVSNAEDGDIRLYRLGASGELEPGPRARVARLVMPMAVSPDRRFLYAATRSSPYALHAFAIDPATGVLAPLGLAPSAWSYPHISLDRTGRFLFAASYDAHLVSVTEIGGDGRPANEPLQVTPTARHAHAIRVDWSNRYVFASHLGSDQLFQFRFDQDSGHLSPNNPPFVALAPHSGPRHFVVAPGNRFIYLLNELVATVTTLALDATTGLLTVVDTVAALPPDSRLRPGTPRGAVGAPGVAARNTDADIWAADIQITPDGNFLYVSERTGSTLSAFAVCPQKGSLAWRGITPTERQPRGFAIDPASRFLVASGERSETLSVHAIDPTRGTLSLIGQFPAGRGANWVEIASFPRS